MYACKAREELNRYIELTLEIRNLSSPRVGDMKSAEEYRLTLLQNFERIGLLARENNRILETYWFPLVEKEAPLTGEERETVKQFRDKLLDSVSMENLDLPLLFRGTQRLLREAEAGGDADELVHALDETVSAAAHLHYMMERVNAVSTLSYRYRDLGLHAAERLLLYLEHDRFSGLSDDSKQLVLINARYISSLWDRSDRPGDAQVNAADLAQLKRALELENDPFYREQLPAYNWVYHRFRTLQYASHLAYNANQRGFDEEQLRWICDRSKELAAFWKSHREELATYCTQELIDLTVTRATYLAGELNEKQYRKTLYKIYLRRDDNDFSFHSCTLHLVLPVEYIHGLPEQLSEKHKKSLAIFYRVLIDYIHRMPKRGPMSFSLTYLGDILQCFVRVPDGPDFETLCLQLIAALHPPTYVHTNSVAAIAVCLTKYLIRYKPNLLSGFMGSGAAQNGFLRTQPILDFVRHAALCHDIGKLMVLEEIITYGRQLLDEEFELIRLHPAIGANMLSRWNETRPYTDIALLHHKWYNDGAGYPPDRENPGYPDKTLVAIVACADCIDAATDAVGRSYKAGITLDDFLKELAEGGDTRYAPWLEDLLSHPEVRADVNRILTQGRDENYRKAYEILVSNST